MFSSNNSQVSSAANYIEDVFSTYLFDATGSTVTINNGIDLSTKGGLLWLKQRNGADNHILRDNVAMATSEYLKTNSTAALSGGITNTFLTNGFSTTAGSSGNTYASWTFRKQPKFFDVVTWTGNGVQGRAIPHSLGSTPGVVIIKCTSNVDAWYTWHRSVTSPNANWWRNQLLLNSTAAASDFGDNTGLSQSPDATSIYVGNNVSMNGSGRTYVAYIFAHNAGGFGLTGTDNVISCGSFTTDGSGNATVSLGYEPQWVLLKNSTGTAASWFLLDTMRGWDTSTNDKQLLANSSNAEADVNIGEPNATGFTVSGRLTSQTYIYIAIRRGPMKVPTDATKVYGAYSKPKTTGVNYLETAFPADTFWAKNTTSSSFNWFDYDRLRGNKQYLAFNTTGAEVTGTGNYYVNFNTSTTTYPFVLQIGETNDYNTNVNNTASVFYWLRRAPSFFDEVIVTTNGQASAITSTHNLGVVPEMMIAKKRGPTGGVGDWSVYHSGLNGGVTPQNYRIRLNTTGAAGAASGVWNNTTPTATQFTIGTDGDVNSGTSGDTTAFWLFASCPGVSKVGSYTGTGTSPLSIDCGFTGGARFVMIKRTDSTGDWYVWDTARGMVSGTDPYLLLNSTAAEVNTDRCFTATGGFQIIYSSPTVNAVGGKYIFLAIA